MSSSSLRLPWWSRLSALGAGWPALREYFAYHGVWAVGVRLLRKLSVQAKVLLVMGITAAPLLPLSWYAVQAENVRVAATTRQLAMLRLEGAGYALAAQLNDQTMASEQGSLEAMPGMTAGWQRLLQAEDQALEAGLVVQQAWDSSRPAIERAVSARGLSPLARLEVNHAAVMALVEIHGAMLESSAMLTAEGRRESRASTALALETLPALQIALGGLRERAHGQPAPDARGAERERHDWQLDFAVALADARRLADTGERQLAQPVSRRDGTATMLPAARAYLDQLSRQYLAYEASAAAPVQALYVAARLEVRQLRDAHYLLAEQGLQADLQAARRIRACIFGALALTLSLAFYLLYTFFLVMRGGLVQLNQQMTRMAQGDLSARLSPLGVDEVADTMRAMNTSLLRLSDLLAAVRQGVSSVTQASQQVALGNADLSTRNRETTQGLTAVVDGIARYAAQLQSCGRQVEAVVRSVQALRLESVRNRRQMQRLRERMTALRSKSREIGEIVVLIDAIAFRTNILALNASVEASKAGEAGRGFAVVAQEVRALAMRGADSARRIGDIVARSTEDIELSGALAEETGAALASADQHVDQIHVAMDDVAALTHSGELESGQILQELTQIKDGTAQNLQLVEQLARASSALRSQGERLAHRIGQFRLS